MYGLRVNTDLSFLEGKILLQVCIGQNEAILRFDGDIAITVQSDIGHKRAGIPCALYKSIIPSAPMLVSFLHSSIVRASAELPGTLVLEFSNVETLEVYDSNSDYESYQITNGSNMIIV